MHIMHSQWYVWCALVLSLSFGDVRVLKERRGKVKMEFDRSFFCQVIDDRYASLHSYLII